MRMCPGVFEVYGGKVEFSQVIVNSPKSYVTACISGVCRGDVCDRDAQWRSDSYGAGIIDAAALLAKPLSDAGSTRSLDVSEIEDLPLWTSIYPQETGVQIARQDYRRIFRLEPGVDLESVAIYEAEITYHYATSTRVVDAVGKLVSQHDRSEAAFESIRRALLERDLSKTLRQRLQG